MATPTVFPSNRSILWDRTPQQYPIFMHSNEIVPDLTLSMNAVQSLLEQIYYQSCNSASSPPPPSSSSSSSSSVSKTVDRIATVIVSNQNSKKPFVLQLNDENGSVSNSPTAFSTNNHNPHNVINDNKLTIPFSIRQTSDTLLSYDRDTTHNLIQNLGKTIRSSREFSLKSCLRIRAAAHVQQSRHRKINGMIRFEAILPNVSFQAIKIKSVPVLPTPLSIKLMSSSSSSSDGSPQMGYLTMNQTRKLVPLLETDPSVSMVPIIGVWTRVSDTSDATFLTHPITWGSCIRYIFSDKIQDKAFVADNTFLLCRFDDDSCNFYEVTKLPQSRNTSTNTSDMVPLSTADDYLCSDFAVELSVTPGDLSYSEDIRCKFKPLSRVDYIQAFKDSSSSSSSSSCVTGYTTNKSQELKLSPPSSSSAKTLNHHPIVPSSMSTTWTSINDNKYTATNILEDALSVNTVELTEMDTAAPLPRCDPPSPSTSPQKPVNMGSLSSSTNSVSSSQQHQPYRYSEVASSGVYSNNVAAVGIRNGSLVIEGSTLAYPAEIIVAQQMQLDQCRQQIEELRQLIIKLGGSLPTSSTNNDILAAAAAAAVCITPTTDAAITSSSVNQISYIESDVNDAIAYDTSIQYTERDEVNSLLEEEGNSYLDTNITMTSDISSVSLQAHSTSSNHKPMYYHRPSNTSSNSSSSHHYRSNPLNNLIPSVSTIRIDVPEINDYCNSSNNRNSNSLCNNGSTSNNRSVLDRNIDILEQFSMLESDSILAIQAKYLSKQ